MKKRIVLSVIAAMLICSSLTQAQAVTWQEHMLTSLNAIRAEKGLSALSMCRPLTLAAQRYSREMAQQNFLAHEGKDGSTPGDRIQRAGYDWSSSITGSMIAENIAAGQRNVAEVMRAWKKSTSHYKNMTETKFTHVGFGLSENKKSKYKKYWVQNFGYGANC